jgi:DNA (cytosine-5)-methyltransferase 1
MTHAGYFEGIGGFSLGAERAGIETIYTCELDEFRHNWLKYYLPHANHETDITKAKGMYADIFTAGFPCQDISSSNPKGKGLHGERSGLFFEFMRYVRLFRPKYVVLENSPNVISKRYLLNILREFATCGYHAEWDVNHKKILGNPDERERFILIAYTYKIGRNENNRIFTRKSFENGKQKVKQGKHVQHEFSRKNSTNDWTKIITELLQMDTGLSPELVKNEIAAYGDAVCPDVAQLCFELIKFYEDGT